MTPLNAPDAKVANAILSKPGQLVQSFQFMKRTLPTQGKQQQVYQPAPTHHSGVGAQRLERSTLRLQKLFEQLFSRIDCSRLISLFLFLGSLCLGWNAHAFNIGDRVQVINGPIWVRLSAGGTWSGYTQATGNQGTVLAGPTYAQVNGSGAYYNWYSVNFEIGRAHV